MKIGAIVAEYNPFHNGHAFQISKTVENAQCSHIIVVMSGNFTQRGEPALFSKYTRAKAALLCGADLIVELPLPWAMSRAENFAFGAVYIANALGCVDVLSFGSESGDVEKIKKAAHTVCTDEFSKELSPYLSAGMSFAAARQRAAEQILGEDAQILSNPNDTLGIEYCKALGKLNSAIEPFCVKRTGAMHDGDITADEFASASYLRKNGEFSGFVPEKAAQIYKNALKADASRLETAILAQLRRMTKEEFARLPDVSEGLENRIFEAVRKCGSVNEILETVKTKRYSMARLRRIIMSAFLGIRAEDALNPPPYIRVIGFNEKGREILSRAGKTAALPILSKASQLKRQSSRIFELECLSSDLYSLAFTPVLPCGTDMTYFFENSFSRERSLSDSL